jgi:hypothetical protein
VVVGGAGCGKSALAVELAEFLDVPVIATALESAGVSAALLPHRLRSAAARVGLSDLAALMDQAAPAGPMRTCYFSQTGTQRFTFAAGKSTGKFAGASGPGAYQIFFGAFVPRITSGKNKGEYDLANNVQPLAKGAVAKFLAVGVLTVG